MVKLRRYQTTWEARVGNFANQTLQIAAVCVTAMTQGFNVVYLAYLCIFILSLQRRRMRAMASDIIGHYTVCSTVYPKVHHRKHRRSTLMSHLGRKLLSQPRNADVLSAELLRTHVNKIWIKIHYFSFGRVHVKIASENFALVPIH